MRGRAAISGDMRSCVVGFFVVVVAGCGVEGAPEDGTVVDVEDLAAARGPTISSVATSDGFTQLRQHAVVPIVIRGKKLNGATAVTVGTTAAQIDHVTPREIRATVATYGGEPVGPIDVAVTTPRGTTTRTGALELTPFVVSPTATAGHGTFQSPMPLCDPELEQTGVGTTVLLLPGTHRCGRLIAIGAGTTVLGDTGGGTIATGTADGGFGIEIANGRDGVTTTLRDVTFAPPLAPSSIATGRGSLVVSRVTDAGGIFQFDAGGVAIDHYTYDGEGTALDLIIADIASATIRHCGAGDAIQIAAGVAGFGRATITDVVVEDCARGLVASNLTNDPQVTIEVARSRFDVTGVGIRNEGASITATDVAIHGGLVGVSVPNGFVGLAGGEIAGHSRAGIEVLRPPFGGGDPFPASVLNLADLEIAGGQYGVFFLGIDNSLVMHGSTVRDQTIASVHMSAIDSFYELGDNALSVVSGFALDDQRNDCPFFSPYLDAAGTTLNGVDFAGQTIEAPAELAPHYRTARCGIQF